MPMAAAMGNGDVASGVEQARDAGLGQAVAKRDKVVRGTFRRAMAGFGFVRPGDGSSAGESVEDIFIPPGATAGALDGDTVEVRLRPRGDRRGDALEGYIDKILQRGRRQFTGTVEMRGAVAWVHLDGVPYDLPIEVGDVRGLPVSNDDKVFVEIVEFPKEDGSGGEGVLLEVLGKTTNPAIDTLTVMRQYALPEQFSDEVLAEARAQADAFTEDTVSADRRDLTNLLTITIDPFDARDFDDAVSLEKVDGRWTLWVHIADVSTFVPQGGVLDQEAEKRATSVYLPDRVIPMIPEVISNHLASLQPHKIRLTKTVEIEMRDDGVVTSVEVYNAAIRSDWRFNYEQVDEFIADPESKLEPWGDVICDLLGRMHRLAMSMRRRRFNRGSLTLEVPEVKIDLDKNGKVKGAHVAAYTESHQIIEEFMLAANQAVATWLDDQELNFLHRIHPPPDRRKLRQLEQFAKDLRLPVTAVQSRRDIQKILDLVAGTPLENAVNFAVLKSMSKAIYAPHREGHYALDMEHYCHFTSPIRRYPDLTVHRLVQNLIDRQKTPDDPFAVLLRLGFHCSDQERNAAQAERELVQLKLLHYMKKKVGDTMRVIINRVFADGLFARGVEFPIDGYLPVTALPPDKYRFERRGQMVVGFKEGNQFRLGDELAVRIAKVDLRERQLFFEFVKHVSAGKDTLKGSLSGKRDRLSKPKSKRDRDEPKRKPKRDKKAKK
jgi:ribonuclease R